MLTDPAHRRRHPAADRRIGYSGRGRRGASKRKDHREARDGIGQVPPVNVVVHRSQARVGRDLERGLFHFVSAIRPSLRPAAKVVRESLSSWARGGVLCTLREPWARRGVIAGPAEGVVAACAVRGPDMPVPDPRRVVESPAETLLRTEKPGLSCGSPGVV
jgi:hypothetical protein